MHNTNLQDMESAASELSAQQLGVIMYIEEKPGHAGHAKLSTIRQIAITVSDVETSVAFYHGILGLDLLFRAGPNLAFLDASGVRIMLTTPQGAGTVGANSILYFSVSDIAAVHHSLVAQGAVNERSPALAAKMQDHDLWTGFLRDPDGNLVGLMEEKPHDQV